MSTCSLSNSLISVELRIFTARRAAKYTSKRIFARAMGSYSHSAKPKEGEMLYWTLVFLVIAIIAGVLGFTGVAVAAAGIAKLLFVIFLVLFVISLITHLGRRRGTGI
jgi:uncharacterized membrane protein YtjA (UPF0391 family)